MTDALAQLSEAGVSVWLDDLSRELLNDGSLQRLIDEKHVVGVTTNPTIFASALSKGDAYDEQLRAARRRRQGRRRPPCSRSPRTTSATPATCCARCTTGPTARTAGSRSRSTRAWPTTPRATVEMAKRLWAAVDRPNVLIKIPATVEGLPAISQTIAAGISVNVTLIFALDRYRGVMQAFLTGLEQAREAGIDLSTIRSVASFFVSRVDTEIDPRLDEIGSDEAKALRGKAAVANARLAFQAFEEVFSTPRWQVLAEDGAHPQRPLWASTGREEPGLPGHALRDRAGHRRHRQHHAERHHGRRRRPRRDARRHHPRRLRRRPQGAGRAGAARHLLRRRDRRAGARGRREVREELGRAAAHGQRRAGPPGRPASPAEEGGQ